MRRPAAGGDRAGALIPATDVGVRVALPRLVDEDDLEHANVLLSIGDQVGALVGPAAAGLLIGVIGAPSVLLLDAASFLAMAVLVRPVPTDPGWAVDDRERAVPGPAGRGSGVRLLVGDRTVRAVLGVTLVYFLAYGPLEPALPLYSRDVLHAGAGGYGLLWSAFGAGALVGLVAVPVVARLRPGVVLGGNSLLWGVALLPLLHVTGTVPAMLVLALGGLIWAPYAAVEASLLQRVVPAPRLGWVFGVRRAISAAAVPLGAAAGGLLLDAFTPTAVIGVSAGTCIVAGAAALCSPSLRRLRAGGGPRAPG